MSKYTPSQFASIIYRSWGNLFKNLTDEQKAEILMAITLYPDYEPKGENFAWDFIKEELDKQYEKFIARKEQAQNAVKQRGTSVNVSQQALTKDNIGQRQLTPVNHKPEPIPEPESEPKESKKKSSAVHRFALTAIPSSWLDYAKSARPDLDPEREFQDFRFYFTEGRGSTETRNDRGWNQSWQGWIRRANARPKPEEKPNIFTVPEEIRKTFVKPKGDPRGRSVREILGSNDDGFSPDHFDISAFGVAK